MTSADHRYIDLHCHSTASDGSLSPAAVVDLAGRAELSALSLTDHDTVAGIPAASARAAELGIQFMPGIEISAEFPRPGTLHILGYGVDPNSPVLERMTQSLLQGRDARNPKIIEKLRDLGLPITMRDVENEAGGSVIGRPHIAAALVRLGRVHSSKEAFDRYLAPGGLAYFDKERLAPGQAIEMIRQSGGIPVLAHPFQLRAENSDQLELFVKGLVDDGLRGIEVIHSEHSPQSIEQFTALADRFRLLKTGGSDFHGAPKKDIRLGWARGRRISHDYFEPLLAACRAQTREPA